jgi:hemolysin activation/secretion protein
LLERFAGYNLGVSRRFGDRFQARFDFGSFHQKWDPTTIRALEDRQDVPGIYRERYHMSPSLSVGLNEPLVLTVGLDLQHMQTQFPAATFQASNAVTITLRYRKRWGSDASGQEVEAGYGLRAATKVLDSDFVYGRHLVHAEYKASAGEHAVSVEVLAGAMGGQAPLFERFTLGDSRTLRGWTRYDIAPVGGSRVSHASLEYTYRWLGFFYDTGAVWERDHDADVKHSVGVGVGGKEGMFLALAFPLRSGSVSPLLILGMNF